MGGPDAHIGCVHSLPFQAIHDDTALGMPTVEAVILLLMVVVGIGGWVYMMYHKFAGSAFWTEDPTGDENLFSALKHLSTNQRAT